MRENSLIVLAGILVFFTSTFLYAQDGVLSPDEQPAKYNYNKILLVPYDAQRAYLVTDNTDREIAKYNKKDLAEFRNRVRFGLNEDIYFRMMTRYDSKSLLTDRDPGVQKDLDAVMRNVGYQYEIPFSAEIMENEEEKKKFFDRIKEMFKKPETDETDNMYTSARYKMPEKGENYMNVKIKDKELMTYLSEKYKTDIFVFINMIEMKTDFKTCLDLATKNYAREITVHFSIFDKDSNQLWGDKVTSVLGSNTNNLEEIISKNFPLISRYMAFNLPRREKIDKK